jgi:hypothetical protein
MLTIRLYRIAGITMLKSSTLKSYNFHWISNSLEGVRESAPVHKRFISWAATVKSTKLSKFKSKSDFLVFVLFTIK